MTQALAPIQADDKRQAALLKAVGLDKVPPEQRELAMAIADRYGLDLLLKHIVLIDGRPYITRDGLLHIAHRSGVFDGMEVSDPTIVDIGPGKFWSARCSVYRKDMTRPFTYAGRYPTQGGNQKFAPEMATKVSEVMALRRAFDVSAPVLEERWDLDTPAPEPEPAPSLEDRIAERAKRVTTSAAQPVPAGQRQDDAETSATSVAPPAPETDSSGAGDAVPETAFNEPGPARCEAFHDALGRCRRRPGHPEKKWAGGIHVGADDETWTNPA
jgi:hypothetical protein